MRRRRRAPLESVGRQGHLSTIRSGKVVRRQFDQYVVPLWDDRDVQTITKRDVIELLDGIMDAGKATTAMPPPQTCPSRHRPQGQGTRRIAHTHPRRWFGAGGRVFGIKAQPFPRRLDLGRGIGHVPLKTLVVIARCGEGASIALEGCTCPGCAGQMLTALVHGFRERWPAPAPGRKVRH